MESRATIVAICCILVVPSTLFTTLCDARIHGKASKNNVKSVERFNKYSSLGYSDFNSYGSPSSLPLPPFNSVITPQLAPETSTPLSPFTPSLPPPPKHAPKPPPPPPPSSSNSAHHKKAVWCVAKPTVPDPIIKAAMDYACGSGAECKNIQPNGACYIPNTMLAHASYAFNSYWQNTKVGGGTCDFGGTAMLVTVDPMLSCPVFRNKRSLTV
ncbi:hypothetical protein AHAS_Ahas14G0013500 [Arachis hypogaea]